MRKSTSKVKVQTASLLEAVKKRREQAQKEYVKQLNTYEKELRVYKRAVLNTLTEQLAEVKSKDTILNVRSYRSALEIPYYGPPQPTKPHFHTQDLDRLIKTLEMAAEDTITISADDAAQYLG